MAADMFVIIIKTKERRGFFMLRKILMNVSRKKLPVTLMCSNSANNKIKFPLKVPAHTVKETPTIVVIVVKVIIFD